MSTPLCETLLEQLPVGILWRIIDEGGRHSEVFANQAARSLLKLNEQQLTLDELAKIPVTLDEQLTSLKGLPPLQLSPLIQALSGESVNRRDLLFRQRPLHIKSIQLTLNHTFEAAMSAPSSMDQLASARPRECFAVCLQPRDHRLFVESTLTHDLSDMELSVRDLLAFDKLLSELSSRFIHADPSQMNEHIDAALKAVGQFCMADRCYVFSFDTNLMVMRNTHEWVAAGISAHIDELQDLSAQDLPWFFNIMQQQGVLIINDIDDLPDVAAAEYDLFSAESIHSVMCVGISLAGKLSGFVGCDMVIRGRHWSEADIRRLKMVGEIIGQGLQSQSHLRALEKTQQELVNANHKLQLLADEDSLTKVANRRHFDRQIDLEVRRAIRLDHDLCLMMIDVDRFKSYNDLFGHIQGDAALLHVANLLKDHFKRSGELVTRYGGEEFAVILPGATYNEAVASAGHLLERMEHKAIAHPGVPQQLLSLSIGVASLQNLLSKIGLQHMESDVIIASLLEQSDQALYRAKSNGRNCVVGAC